MGMMIISKHHSFRKRSFTRSFRSRCSKVCVKMEKNATTTNGRVYEEFDPIVRWESQPGFDNLVVYLPGFSKEHLKVQVTSAGKLRVLGERPGVGATKWIRFVKEFPLPPNLDINAITAKFEGVNLHIKIQKLASSSSEKPNPPAGAAVPRPQVTKPSNNAPGAQVRPVTQPQPQPQPQPQNQQPAKETVKHGSKEPAGMEKDETGEKRQLTTAAAAADSDGLSKRAKRGEKPTTGAGNQKQSENEEGTKGLQNYKKLLTGMRMELKNKRKLTIGLVMAAALVMAIGIYASKRVRCTIG